ncbi:tyrosyl-tRNA synthetase [Catenaria anguillulae PL171]|uniref:Tyrosine--tRNA ligase n=1 Tax=Catenaria anguillulae PL171 TaxID=765915 RepID=A0A1Y2HM73_9FUNG|nr:tyrosyl-tRNA synthetase [Catenaria anguillulae PL171]
MTCSSTTNATAAAARRLLSPLAADLQARGLIHAVTSPALLTPARLSTPLTLYTGIDPTAPSPHIGNLLPLTASLRFLLHGHNVLALIGGATGSIGDPSGRATERSSLSSAVLAANEAGITTQVHRFFENGVQYATRRGYTPSAHAGKVDVVNNKHWTSKLSLIDFLDQVGRHARVSAMLARDSVASRMQSDQGISFTEFTYQLVQANDFAHLHRERGCTLQIGGSDQWGNIVAGLDLIRRTCSSSGASAGTDGDDNDNDKVFGLTLPLVTTSTGEKFGKSAGNAVWLDPAMTSPYDYFQFWMRTHDADVGTYLKMYTLLPLDHIAHVMHAHAQRPEDRSAQNVLASEMTELVHAPEALSKVKKMSGMLFAKDGKGIRDVVDREGGVGEVVAAFEGDPRLIRVRWADLGDGTAPASVAEVFAKAGACRSKSEAIKLAKKGGLYLNQDRITDAQAQKLTRADLIGGQLCLLRTGKSNYWILQVVMD